VFDVGCEQARQIALFPEDRLGPALNCDVVHVPLSGLRLYRPRKWGLLLGLPCAGSTEAG
jgi:hypothetical protein